MERFEWLEGIDVSITFRHREHEEHEEHEEREEHEEHEEHKPARVKGAPQRPGKDVGTSRGSLDGSPVTTGDIEGKHPPHSWPDERKNLFTPFLFFRANPGDTGSRPVAGPFWESPDIYLLAGVQPQNAPDVPAHLGQTAKANAPNTIYAHVWNFGKSAANEVVVEFYWLDPALGISGGGVHLIGQALTNLGSRYSGSSHRVVKCPEAWEAKYENGGHECLLVRAWDVCSDALSTPEWDASLNRHIAQRNIHVVPASELHSPPPPLTLKVGPLYGGSATVKVERAQPSAVPWLQLHNGARGVFQAPGAGSGTPQLSPPSAVGGSAQFGASAQSHTVSGDNQQVVFTTSDAAPSGGQALAYRITANQDGQTVGGYTFIITG